MTAQTVPVPVDLLKRLFDNTIITRDVFHGDSVEVSPEGLGALGALSDIKGLIPVPPKVGDKLTADEAAKLPWRSVVVDKDGDPWVRDAGDGGERVPVQR